MHWACGGGCSLVASGRSSNGILPSSRTTQRSTTRHVACRPTTRRSQNFPRAALGNEQCPHIGSLDPAANRLQHSWTMTTSCRFSPSVWMPSAPLAHSHSNCLDETDLLFQFANQNKHSAISLKTLNLAHWSLREFCSGSFLNAHPQDHHRRQSQ